MGTAHHKAGGEQREATTSQGKALSHLQRPGELHSTASRQACGEDGGAAPGEKDFLEEQSLCECCRDELVKSSDGWPQSSGPLRKSSRLAMLLLEVLMALAQSFSQASKAYRCKKQKQMREGQRYSNLSNP